jgi:hypothetical protein
MQLGGDSAYVQPPGTIEIRNQRGSEGFERRGYIIRPAPGFRASVHRFAFAQPTTDSVSLAWTNGFSGVWMMVASRPDSLLGTARTSWDFDHPSQTASVRLVKVRC